MVTDSNFRLGIVDDIQARRQRIADANSAAVRLRILGPAPKPRPIRPASQRVYKANLPHETIIAVAAEKFEITVQQLKGQDRAINISRGRQAAYCLLRELLKYSYPEMAIATHRRDHTSSRAGYLRAMELREDDREFARRYDEAKARCLGLTP